MLEKGLLSHYSQNRYEGNVRINTVSDEKIDGLQWSLNTSFGVDYKLIKNYSIYLEPKVSYYLKNNQPMSARTENPLIIGFNAGIRYSW
jgi:predicted porin